MLLHRRSPVHPGDYSPRCRARFRSCPPASLALRLTPYVWRFRTTRDTWLPRPASSIIHVACSQTMSTTGIDGSCASRTLLFTNLLPGMIGPWHSGQYSLYFTNHSSRQCEWKACEHRSPRTCASSANSSRQMALRQSELIPGTIQTAASKLTTMDLASDARKPLFPFGPRATRRMAAT